MPKRIAWKKVAFPVVHCGISLWGLPAHCIVAMVWLGSLGAIVGNRGHANLWPFSSDRLSCTCTATDQLRRFFLAFLPSAAFPGDALTSCACPAWPDLFRCFFFFPKPGSLPNLEPRSP